MSTLKQYSELWENAKDLIESNINIDSITLDADDICEIIGNITTPITYAELESRIEKGKKASMFNIAAQNAKDITLYYSTKSKPETTEDPIPNNMIEKVAELKDQESKTDLKVQRGLEDIVNTRISPEKRKEIIDQLQANYTLKETAEGSGVTEDIVTLIAKQEDISIDTF